MLEILVNSQIDCETADDGIPHDSELLTRFVRSGCEQSFQRLVERHGSMVLNVCQRQLSSRHDAEDVAQAVFLVMWKKAQRLRSRRSVAGWLHRVARNLCLHAKRASAARARNECEAAEMTTDGESANDAWFEIKEVLDDELDRLPEKYRLPIVLFHLEGNSQDEIAALLGTKRATVATRLGRGRELLRSRLARRGIKIATAGLVVSLTTNACSAAVPTTFVTTTTQAASLFAAGNIAAGGILSAKTAAFAKGAIHMMTIAKLKSAAALIVAATVVTGGGVAVVQHVHAEQQREQLSPKTFGRLHATIKPQPSESLWRQVPWHISVREAHRQAATEGKPIFVWTANDSLPIGNC